MTARSRSSRLPAAILLAAGLMLVAGLGGLPRTLAQTADKSRLNAKTVTLQEMLEKGLQARRPAEFAFIDRVVQQVHNGTLPLDLVRGTFDWARNKRPYPYPYFERALKVRAARQGITVE
jgi:hypothetical protein